MLLLNADAECLMLLLMLDAGCSMLDAQCLMLDARCRMLDAQCYCQLSNQNDNEEKKEKETQQ